MTVCAHAKVNLSLEVYGLRKDGFHDLKSIVQPVSLCDELTFDPAEAFTTDTGYAADLILKAAQALARHGGRAGKTAYAIRVAKRIPVGGGLGGGSADAAATLLALNELWCLGKPPEELAAIGAEVGSDVPALVLANHYRRPVLMEGRGERVTVMPPADNGSGASPQKAWLVLVNPGVSVSTPKVYAACVARTEPPAGRVNDLEGPAIALCPAITRTLDALRAEGARDVMMSGSGATCFGFVPEAETAETVADRLRALGYWAWAVFAL